MSDTELEEQMLTSAFENFLENTARISTTESTEPSTFDLANQMYSIFREILKDILIQANLHLDCYRCHEKLLLSDHSKLTQRHNTLASEFQSLQLACNEPSPNKLMIDQYKSERIYLEDQIIKYKLASEQLRTSQEQYVEKLKDSCNISKIKDCEIKNLQNEVERLKTRKNDSQKSIFKSNSEKHYGISKLDIRPITSNSNSLGISQRSTTFESSRGSHSHT